MQGHWGMGPGISSLPALRDLGINSAVPEDKPKGGGGIGFGVRLVKRAESGGGVLGQRIEADLARLLDRAEEMLTEHRAQVLSLAHALERHKTLSGDDVVAVLENRLGPIVDGRIYDDPRSSPSSRPTTRRPWRRTAGTPRSPRRCRAPRTRGRDPAGRAGGRRRAGAAAAASNGRAHGWPPPPLPPKAHAEENGASTKDADVSEQGGAGSAG